MDLVRGLVLVGEFGHSAALDRRDYGVGAALVGLADEAFIHAIPPSPALPLCASAGCETTLGAEAAEH